MIKKDESNNNKLVKPVLIVTGWWTGWKYKISKRYWYGNSFSEANLDVQQIWYECILLSGKMDGSFESRNVRTNFTSRVVWKPPWFTRSNNSGTSLGGIVPVFGCRTTERTDGNYCTKGKLRYFMCWMVRWRLCRFVWFISSTKWWKWWIWCYSYCYNRGMYDFLMGRW